MNRKFKHLALAVALGACNSGGGDAGTDAGGGCDVSACDLATVTNATPLPQAADGGDFQCSYSQILAFEPCVSESDGNVRVTFLCSEPAAPAQGLNSFTVAVTDGQGNPLPNLPLSVSLWMPQHCHGPQYQPTVDGGAGGLYTVSNAYLFMDGVWQLTFTVDGGYQGSCPPSPATGPQFDFCVGG